METDTTRWKTFYDEGVAYYERAVRGESNGYTPELLHGIVSMAAEKLLMALILSQHRMPEGHTFAELINAVSGVFDADGSLRSDLALLDDMIPLCSLDPARSWKIDPAIAPKIMGIASKIRSSVDNALDKSTGGKP